MKIFYNSKIAKLATFIKDFKTIMLFGMIFTEHEKLSYQTISHEEVHSVQYQTLLGFSLALSLMIVFCCFFFDIYGYWMFSFIPLSFLTYYLWYGIEYLIKLCIYKNSKEAYENISFEREAYSLDKEYLKPCGTRNYPFSFSFIKYLK